MGHGVIVYRAVIFLICSNYRWYLTEKQHSTFVSGLFFFFLSLLHLQLFADFIVCGGSSSSVELSSFKSVMDMRVVNVAKTISCTCDKYVVTGFACLGFGCSSTSLSLTHTHLFYFLLAPLSTDLRKMTKRSGSASKKKIFPFQQPVTCDKVSI